VSGSFVTPITSSLLKCVSQGSQLGLGEVRVGVSINDGADFSLDQHLFIFDVEASLFSLVPSKAFAAGKMQLVTVLGSHFVVGEGQLCLYGRNSYARGLWISSTAVLCSLVGIKEGNVTISVTNYQREHFDGPTQGLVFEFEGGLSSGLVNTDGTETESIFVDALWPSTGAVSGGTLLRLEGQGFEFVSCRFGLQPVVQVSAFVLTSTSARCLTPASAVAGGVQVQVTSDKIVGTSMPAKDWHFVYEDLGSVQGLQPSKGQVEDAGQRVTVFGKGFSSREGSQCQFGASKISAALYVTSTLLVCTQPALRAGSITVTVVVNGGDICPGAAQFVVVGNIFVVSVTPSRGPVSGGTLVSVQIAGLVFEEEDISCHFGPVTIVGEQFGGKVFCVSPRSSSVSGEKVQFSVSLRSAVTQISGTASHFEYYVTSVTSVLPTHGPVEGGNVVSVLGSGFMGGDTVLCRFGETSASRASIATRHTSSMLTCISPPSQWVGQSVPVQVSINGGLDFTLSGPLFHFNQVLIVTSVQPSILHVGIGQQGITIFGMGFEEREGLQCRFGRKLLTPAYFISTSLISCFAPIYGEGFVAIDVVFSLEEAGTESKVFLMWMSPVKLHLLPSSGPASGGSLITMTINGENGFHEVSVMFGSVLVYCGKVVDSSVVCVSPGLGVCNKTLIVDVQVMNTLSSMHHSFEYRSCQRVVSLHPTNGAVSGGHPVTVIGEGFVARVLVCKFGLVQVLGNHVQFLTSTAVVVMTPQVPGSAGEVAVEVSVNNGTDFTSNGQIYVYMPDLTVLTFKSHTGSETAVVVSGYHFQNTKGLSCSFGLMLFVQGQFLSSTAVVCPVPDEIEGNFTVSVSNNAVDFLSSKVILTLQIQAPLANLVPSCGPAKGGILVHLTFKNSIISSLANISVAVDGSHVEVTREGPGNSVFLMPPVSREKGKARVTFKTDNSLRTSTLFWMVMDDIKIESIWPGMITASKDLTRIAVYGQGFSSCTEKCRVGGSVFQLFFISSTHMECNVGPLNPGILSFELGSRFEQLPSSGVELIVNDAAEVLNLVPAWGGYGAGVLTVFGKNFVRTPFLTCRVGDSEMAGRWVSSSIVFCHTYLDGLQSSLAVEISNDGTVFSSNGRLLLAPIVKIKAVVPSQGPTSGGTVCTVLFSEAVQVIHTPFCNFGAESVPGELGANNSVCCKSPVHRAGPIELTVHDRSEWISRPSTFLYVSMLDFEDILLTQIWPAHGSVLGGTDTV
jgi:hypothetical protein